MSKRFEFHGGGFIREEAEDIDAAEFWRRVPERCRLALAQAAPQVIPAWEPYSLSEGDDRECRDGQGSAFAWIAKNTEGGGMYGLTEGWFRFGIGPNGACGERPTREEARAAADALVLAEGNRVLE